MSNLKQNFKHYLITRFNVKVDSWVETKNGEAVLDTKWLEHRFYLFETYCLPSVKNQINQNFQWCIFFDPDTPEFYKNKIKDIAMLYPRIYIIYITGNHQLLDRLKSIIIENTPEEYPFVITTRLDNDDLLHKGFINAIQELYEPINNTIIDIPKGYKIGIEYTKVKIKDYANNFNPFISLIENKENLRTIISRMHKDWENNAELKTIDNRRLWVELIHSKNKVNAQDLSLPNSSTFNPLDFGITEKKFFISFAQKIKNKIFK